MAQRVLPTVEDPHFFHKRKQWSSVIYTWTVPALHI